VDDEAELHITPNGVYWKELGGFDKVGKAGGQDYPTYVNGTAWHPVWGKPKEHGLDQTEVLALPIGRLNFDFQVVAVGKERGAKGIERRSPVTMRNDKDEQVLSIPEKESGARWYAIRLFRKD